MLVLPEPRGAVTALLLEALPGPIEPLPDTPEPTGDEDLQLALYLCYELHYRGLPGVDEGWEWEPSLLALRAGLERRGTLEQYIEFVVHRSAYQLKEADPHSWALPRLSGGPKAALVEIQADEYGGGDAARIHAQLFADTMDALGLDSRYGAYVDLIPAATLATVNLMSLCGLHRRLRGAIAGHLALFEMTSSIPNARYAKGLRRVGFDDPRATAFFDEHVTADAVHESIAAVDLAGGLARMEPALTSDILWGAEALVELEGRWAKHLLDAWSDGRSSLREGAMWAARGRVTPEGHGYAARR